MEEAEELRDDDNSLFARMIRGEKIYPDHVDDEEEKDNGKKK